MSSNRAIQRARVIKVWVFAALAILGSMLTIAKLRPGLTSEFHKLNETSDVYALPSPEQSIVMSLGYRAALADLIWGNLLVSYGLHFQEKRRFEFVGNYLDTINALDPSFEAPYLFADTLLTLQPKPPILDDYLKAREVQKRGMEALPYSAQLWSTAGQFLAYLAPIKLPTEELRKQWRIEGANALARACELASDRSNIPYHCIAAASLLNRAGQREAVIQMLTRTLAVNDDEQIRKLSLNYLQQAISEREQEKQQRRIDAFYAEWKEAFAFVAKDTVLLLGPKVNTAECAGVPISRLQGCPLSWQQWAEQFERREPQGSDG